MLRDHLLARGAQTTTFSRLFSRFCDLYSDSELTPEHAEALLDQMKTGLPSLIHGYDELEPIGFGGFSRVYRGLETQTGRLVAIKVAARNRAGSDTERPETLEKLNAAFENEWNILSRFPDSQRIVRAYSHGRTDRDKPYIVMELLTGGSLGQYIAGLNDGRNVFDLDHILTMSLEATLAVAELQAAGIVHNDVKAGNFLLTGDQHVKLADCSMGVTVGEARQKTGQKIYRGTPGFIPVQTTESPKKDVLALGATLFALLTGKRAFNPKSPIATLLHTPPPPSKVRPERKIPARFDRIILKAIHHDPGKRYPSALEMAEDLENITRKKTRQRRG
jgi:serine/threonine protein kinase